jgi:hypothetical protein
MPEITENGLFDQQDDSAAKMGNQWDDGCYPCYDEGRKFPKH